MVKCLCVSKSHHFCIQRILLFLLFIDTFRIQATILLGPPAEGRLGPSDDDDDDDGDDVYNDDAYDDDDDDCDDVDEQCDDYNNNYEQ